MEAKLFDVGSNYDFVSIRAGIQPFTSDFRGFLYRDGRFYWLDELTDAKGWTFEYPQAINDAGRITGFGHVSGAQGGHSFVLTPR